MGVLMKRSEAITTTTNLKLDTTEIKDALSGLRSFLAIESPLKLMKKAFYFTSKANFVLQIFKLFSRFFGHVTKWLD